MSGLIRFVLVLAATAVGQQDRRAADRTLSAAALAVVATACAIAALACGLTALWICIQPFVGAAGAWAIVTGVLLATCLALLALSRYRLKPRPPLPADADVPLLVAETTRLVRNHKISTLTDALIAGLIAGSSKK